MLREVLKDTLTETPKTSFSLFIFIFIIFFKSVNNKSVGLICLSALASLKTDTPYQTSLRNWCSDKPGLGNPSF